MSESTDAILRRAHELIENDQLKQAEELLAPLLETESDNPALWWVYAHAVSDSVIGAAALDRVLELDPTYPGARELKAQVLSAQGLLANDLDSELDSAIAQSSPIDDDDIDDWESIKPALDETAANPRAGRGFVLIVVALLILASGAVLVLSGAIDIDEFLSQFSQPTNEPRIVISVPTADATATVSRSQPESTSQPTVAASVIAPTTDGGGPSEPTAVSAAVTVAEAEPTAAPALSAAEVETLINLVGAQVSSFPIEASRSKMRRTQLGMTLDILVCAAPGPEFSARLPAVMNAAADVSDSFPARIQAFAVSLLNCADSSASVRTVGVARGILDDFAAAAIDEKAFQEAWRTLA